MDATVLRIQIEAVRRTLHSARQNAERDLFFDVIHAIDNISTACEELLDEKEMHKKTFLCKPISSGDVVTQHEGLMCKGCGQSVTIGGHSCPGVFANAKPEGARSASGRNEEI